MSDTTEPKGIWVALYTIFALCFLRWFLFPSRTLQEATEDEASILSAPSAPRRRPSPKYIPLASLAKKVDTEPATWFDGYRRGMPEQTTAYRPPPTHNLLVSPMVQRGRWEALAAAATAPAPPVPSPEQQAAHLANFSAVSQPPPFFFLRPKGPLSDWQMLGPAVYVSNSLLLRSTLETLPRTLDRWPPLLPRQRFGTVIPQFGERAVPRSPLISLAPCARGE